MRLQSAETRLSGLAVAVLLVWAPVAMAAPALVVSPAGDASALRAALKEGGMSVLSESETAGVLASAANSGVSCTVADVACWQAVATLAGHDQVVVLTDTEVVLSGPADVRRTPRVMPGPAGVRGGVLRLLGQAGGVVVSVRPPGATVTLDGAAVQGGAVDGLAPGPVTLAASAEGHAPHQMTVAVVAGELARVDVVLVPATVSSPAEAPMAPVLFWGGLTTVGVGAIAGSAIAGINFAANCEFTDRSPSGMECKADPSSEDLNHRYAQSVDYAAIAIGVGLSAVGVGAAVASLFVE